jgi:hypothetical protein
MIRLETDGDMGTVSERAQVAFIAVTLFPIAALLSLTYVVTWLATFGRNGLSLTIRMDATCIFTGRKFAVLAGPGAFR